MRFVIFTHSLVSDWNHGNAHFLRGVSSELVRRGHIVDIYEPLDGWSRTNLLQDQGTDALQKFSSSYPLLTSRFYQEDTLDLDVVMREADVVLVHEWNSASLISAIGSHRSRHNYQLYFHDTHHRILSDRAGISSYDLTHYDAVLAYGNIIRDAYLSSGFTHRAFTWHEAADTRVFHPHREIEKDADLVWVGNWGDNERAESLREFLVRPIKQLGLKARVYGVRYPAEALAELADCGIEYYGWAPNFAVPEIFARHRVTIHVPRGPYVQMLPGIPTIRPFEAMACGIPLISSPWHDVESLFRPGLDFLCAQNGYEMTQNLERVLADSNLSASLSEHGLETITKRHTCGHRVDELLDIVNNASFGGKDTCKLPSLVQV